MRNLTSPIRAQCHTIRDGRVVLPSLVALRLDTHSASLSAVANPPPPPDVHVGCSHLRDDDIELLVHILADLGAEGCRGVLLSSARALAPPLLPLTASQATCPAKRYRVRSMLGATGIRERRRIMLYTDSSHPSEPTRIRPAAAWTASAAGGGRGLLPGPRALC